MVSKLPGPLQLWLQTISILTSPITNAAQWLCICTVPGPFSGCMVKPMHKQSPGPCPCLTPWPQLPPSPPHTHIGSNESHFRSNINIMLNTSMLCPILFPLFSLPRDPSSPSFTFVNPIHSSKFSWELLSSWKPSQTIFVPPTDSSYSFPAPQTLSVALPLAHNVKMIHLTPRFTITMSDSFIVEETMLFTFELSGPSIILAYNRS